MDRYLRLLPFVITLLISSPAASAERYVGVTPGNELKALTITTPSRRIQAPLTEEDQKSFSQAMISPDGSTVGWLAEVTNCCTSYPLPLALVLFRDGKVVYRFSEATAIWRWAYLAEGKEVAYQWTFPHGLVPTYYTRRSLETAAVLAEFVCEINEQTHEYIAPKHIPDWVRAVVSTDVCPRS